MSDKTRIEWTEATWNPVTGCSKVSQGCKHCYAERDWARLSADPKTAYFGRAFTDVRFHPERLDQPFRWIKPRRIFVNSMADLFHEDVPDEFIDRVFAAMARSRWHTYQVLTKRAARMMAYLGAPDRKGRILAASMGLGWAGMMDMPWPLPHVWLGVSVEDQATADARIPLLLQTPAAVRWISAEPLLGPIDLDSSAVDGLHALGCGHRNCECRNRGLDWVVAGGESGPLARQMHPAWVRYLRDECAAAGVPFLFKQWGEWLPSNQNQDRDNWCQRAGKKAAGRHLDGKLHDEYPSA